MTMTPQQISLLITAIVIIVSITLWSNIHLYLLRKIRKSDEHFNHFQYQYNDLKDRIKISGWNNLYNLQIEIDKFYDEYYDKVDFKTLKQYTINLTALIELRRKQIAPKIGAVRR